MRAGFSTPVQTGSGAHLTSFLKVKRPGSGIDHPTPSRAEVEERVELYLSSLSGLP